MREAVLDEPRATMHVWLPIALATIVRSLGARHEGGSGFTTSEILRLFCLPEMAAAMEKDEAENEAENQAVWFDRLAARFGKVETKEDE